MRTIVIGCDLRSPLINRHFGKSCDRAKTANVQTNRISGTTKCRKYAWCRDISSEVNLRVIPHQVLSEIVIANGEASFFVKALLVWTTNGKYTMTFVVATTFRYFLIACHSWKNQLLGENLLKLIGHLNIAIKTIPETSTKSKKKKTFV